MCTSLPTRRLSLSLVLALGSLVILFTSCQDSELPTEADGVRPGGSLGVVASTDPAVLVGAGDIATCGSGTEATAALLDYVIGTNTAGYDLRIFTTGDNAYSDGLYTEFMDCYDPTWGSGGKKSITSPTPGNHDYVTAGAAGYFQYFGAAAQGPSGEPYYSYDIGTWHSIALNSEIGVSTGDPQLLWLDADLQAEVDNHLCTIAYWHRPLFSSGQSHGNDPDYLDFWETLYGFGVDVVLAGHDHLYERFGPQDPYAVADPGYGIRQFTVGTGGAGLDDFSTPQANSEFRFSSMHGVLKLTLLDGSYEWEFMAIDSTIVDSGSGACHGPPVGGPPAPGAAFTWSCSGLDCEFTDLSSVQNVTSRMWDFGDGSPVEVDPTVMHTYQEGGSWEVTLTVANTDGSYSASQTVTAAGIDLTAAWTTGGGGRDKVSLAWSGASGRSVDVYRDGTYLRTTRNDGELSDNATLATHVYRVCEEGTLGCSGEATAVYPSGGNESPIAGFTSSCLGLECRFSDQSSDDGSLSWDWNFGDDGTSTAQDPSHTYASAGTYTVTLTVTDDAGLTDTASESLTVPDDPGVGITLMVSGSKEKGVRYADLSWTGAASPDNLSIYRDDVPIDTVPTQQDGSGSYRDDLGRGGGETFTYQVCDSSVCSDKVLLSF